MRRFVTLVLVSGAGLLAFGVTSLWLAVRDSESRARRAAQQAAVGTARAVRSALKEPRTIELVPENRRFVVADGQLVVPDSIARVAFEVERPRRDLAPAWREAVARADRDPDAALEPRIDPEGAPAERRSAEWLALYRGFRALRSGARERAEAELDEVLASLGASERALPSYRSVLTGAVLLAATLRGAVPNGAARWVARLTATEWAGLRARLAELGLGGDADRLAAFHRDATTRRDVLTIAASRLPLLLASGRAHALPAGEQLVLFWREDESAGGGVGAVVDPAALLSALRDADERLVAPWSGRAAFGPDLPAEAVEVVPGAIGVLPEASASEGAWSRPLGLYALLGACAACFVAGLFASLRAFAREAAAVRARAEFLTSVTHELKTPLASIRLLAERLHEGRVRDGAKLIEYFGMIAGESSRLTVLIENVLDLGRIERGERSYDLRAIELRAVVDEALGIMRPLLESDGVALSADVDLRDVAVRADAGALVQAFVNVLENARKYAADGKRVEVAGRMANGSAELVIRDHGPGIPARERGRIFARFVRGERQNDGCVPGVGLGLYLARSIARAHGGELSCEVPASGSGAAFRFTLPVDPA